MRKQDRMLTQSHVHSSTYRKNSKVSFAIVTGQMLLEILILLFVLPLPLLYHCAPFRFLLTLIIDTQFLLLSVSVQRRCWPQGRRQCIVEKSKKDNMEEAKMPHTIVFTHANTYLPCTRAFVAQTHALSCKQNMKKKISEQKNMKR